jgi:hypothetical protein
MTTLVRVRMPPLVSTMSIRPWKQLNVVEGNACHCSCPTWKLTFRPMVAKVLQITSWVLVRSLPWAQHKSWIPIGLMGCVHTHQRIFLIKGWGSPSHVQSVVEKTKENRWKVGNISQAISQAHAPRPKHDKIWARWALDIPSGSMLERVWWCQRSKIES